MASAPMHDIQVVVFDGLPVNAMLETWLESVPHVKRASRIGQGRAFPRMDMWRNQAVQWFLDHSECEYLLMIDADMVVTDQTNPALRCDASVVGADYVDRGHHQSHHGHSNLGCGFLKVKRPALKEMGAPWFLFRGNPEGTKLTSCECRYFCEKAAAKGLEPVRVGMVGHVLPMIAIMNNGEIEYTPLNGVNHAVCE